MLSISSYRGLYVIITVYYTRCILLYSNLSPNINTPYTRINGIFFYYPTWHSSSCLSSVRCMSWMFLELYADDEYKFVLLEILN